MNHTVNHYHTAYSTQATVELAVAELTGQLPIDQSGLILFFASSQYPASRVSKKMKESFSKATVVGCTTAGELVSGKMLDSSLVAMFIPTSVTGQVLAGAATNIRDNDKSVAQVFSQFEQQLGQPMANLDPDKYVGLVLIDGLSGCEEKINDAIGNLTNVTFIGGSAGDDLKFEQTHVFLNGKAYTNAAVLVLFRPEVLFSLIKTQSFRPTDKQLRVDRTREDRREIIQMNGKPATTAYAEALGVAEEQLSEYMFKNPLALMFGSTPFVRSPRVTEGGSILFYCSVKQDTELTLLESTDIVSDTSDAILETQAAQGPIKAIINFNCILRTLDLKQQGRTQSYADVFKTIPMVGLSTYGESYIGHINQTATLLVFH